MVPWGLYGASDGSLPGRGGSDAASLRSFLAWHWKRNRKDMASTTIARKGFAGLYFLSIDGLAEAGEFRSEFDYVSSLGAETGPDGTKLDIQKRQSEVLVFLPSLCVVPRSSFRAFRSTRWGTNRRFVCWAYRPLFELYLHFQSKGIHLRPLDLIALLLPLPLALPRRASYSSPLTPVEAYHLQLGATTGSGRVLPPRSRWKRRFKAIS